MKLSESRPEDLLHFKLGNRLPVILQTEISECGITCLAMVAGYYGFDIDIINMRRKFSISDRGTTLEALANFASSINLSSRALKVETEQLDLIQTPCILHWNFDHFVVLKSVKKKTVVIHDPAVGVRTVTMGEFNRSFTGVALELYPTKEFKKGEEKATLKISHFWSSVVGLKRSISHVFMLSLILQIFAIASPFYIQFVVDDVVLRNDENLLLILAIGFSLLLVAQAFTTAIREFVVLRLSNLLNMQMAANLFRHLIRLPMNYFSKRHVGDIISRFDSLEAVRHLITVGWVTALVDGVMAVLTLIAMLVYSVKLTIVVLLFVVCYAAIRYMFFNPIRNLNEESIVAQAKQDSHFLETVRAIQTIKLFQMENDRQNEWQNRLADSINKQIGVATWGIRYNIIFILLFGFETIIVVYLAVIEVIEGFFSIGMLFAFISFKGRLVGAMDALINQWMDFKMLDLHLHRLADIAYTSSEDQFTKGKEINGDISSRFLGEIEVKNLSYRYSESDPFIFEGINFLISPGETVAIVGPSGCGKTTLLKCLMGLIRPLEGEIFVDGRPLEKVAGYRNQIAGVMQDDCLISGSILDNICYFSKEISVERAIKCAKLACIHDEISRLSMEYNTLVGDLGHNLSGGQRQRVMLARAIYRNPRILFLDEATSHLDVAKEIEINKNIKQFNITRIIAAHRPETVKSADRIIEL